MKICLLADPKPNPVLTAVVEGLSERHSMTVSDPRELIGAVGGPGAQGGAPADVYLLKSRSPEAQSVARFAEWAGALVVNRPAATAAALDRWAMATLLDLHDVPAPRTWSFPTLRLMTRDALTRHWLPWPLVVKSRTSGRGDLVRLVHDHAELLSLLPTWGDEPVIAQQYIENDGFDVKVWVIGGEVSAAVRPGALESCDKSNDVPIDPADLPAEWAQTALRAGRALGLDLFGVDLLVRDGSPAVIDVNAFPGFRGARDPAGSLLRYLEQLTTARTVHA